MNIGKLVEICFFFFQRVLVGQPSGKCHNSCQLLANKSCTVSQGGCQHQYALRVPVPTFCFPSAEQFLEVLESIYGKFC